MEGIPTTEDTMEQTREVKFGKVTRRYAGTYEWTLTTETSRGTRRGLLRIERGDEWNTWDRADEGWWRVVIETDHGDDEVGEWYYRTKAEAVRAYVGGLVWDEEWGFVGA